MPAPSTVILGSPTPYAAMLFVSALWLLPLLMAREAKVSYSSLWKNGSDPQHSPAMAREKKSVAPFFMETGGSTPTDFSFIYVKKSKQSYTELWARTEKKENRELKCYLAMLPCLMPIFSLSFDNKGKFWFENFLAFSILWILS
jgi:hypothetical protein